MSDDVYRVDITTCRRLDVDMHGRREDGVASTEAGLNGGSTPHGRRRQCGWDRVVPGDCKLQ